MDGALTITIKLDSGSEGGSEPVASPTGGAREQDPGEGSSGMTGVGSALKRLIAPAALVHYANKFAQNEISTVEMRTGAREYEQKLQFGMQAANAFVGLGMSAMTGAAVGGPVGAAVSAGLYAVVFAVNKTIDYTQSVRELNIKEKREDISTGLARLRAGAISPIANGGRE